MKDNLKSIQERTTQYWYSDGVYEFAFGILCTVLALFLFAQAILPREAWFYPILVSGFVVFILGSGFLLARLVNTIKARLTYPRTGYVAYQHKPNRTRVLSFLLGFGIASLVSFLVIKGLIAESMLPAVTGLVFAVAMLFFSLRTGLARFSLIGLAALLTGAALSLFGIGDNLGLCIFFGFMGLTFILSGLCTLRSYLKTTTPVED